MRLFFLNLEGVFIASIVSTRSIFQVDINLCRYWTTHVETSLDRGISELMVIHSLKLT